MSVDKQEYGHKVIIGGHEVNSWGAAEEDGQLLNNECVQVRFGDVEVMIYRSVRDGQIVVDVDDMTGMRQSVESPRVYVNDSIAYGVGA